MIFFPNGTGLLFVKSVVPPPLCKKSIHSILLFFANKLQNPLFAKKSSVSAFYFLQMSFKIPLCKKIFRFSLLFFANELQNPLFAKILRLVPHCANLVPFPPASPNLSPAKKGL